VFTCRPFEETMRDTITWLQAEGKIKNNALQKGL
jgi:hypothetical protein